MLKWIRHLLTQTLAPSPTNSPAGRGIDGYPSVANPMTGSQSGTHIGREEQKLTGPPCCPTCGFAFAKLPKRGGKCSACNSQYVVRSTNRVFGRQILTRTEAHSLAFIQELELGNYVNRDQVSNLLTSHPDVAVGEHLRALFESLTRSKPGDVSLAMLFDRFEAHDKTATNNHARAARMEELRAHQQAGVIDVVEILTVANSCPACIEDDGRRLSLAEAVRTVPLPHRNCECVIHTGERGVCRCLYLYGCS